MAVIAWYCNMAAVAASFSLYTLYVGFEVPVVTGATPSYPLDGVFVVVAPKLVVGLFCPKSPPPPPKALAEPVLDPNTFEPDVPAGLVGPNAFVPEPNVEPPLPNAPNPVAGFGAPKAVDVLALLPPNAPVVLVLLPRPPNIGFACCCWGWPNVEVGFEPKAPPVPNALLLGWPNAELPCC